MTLNYLDCLSDGYSTVFASCVGDPDNYANIVWEGGDPLPSKNALDTYRITRQTSDVWELIKIYRDQLKNSGIYIDNNGVKNWFHSDDPSRIQQLGLKDSARDVLHNGGDLQTVLTKLGQEILWKPMDSEVRVPMTVQLSFDLVKGIGDLDATLFYIADMHRVKMLASPDPMAYDYKVDWPPSYIAVT